MRIWWQSSLDLGVNPAWDQYQDRLGVLLNEIARPGNEVEVHGLEFSRNAIADKSEWGQLLHEAQIIKMAMRAQTEGFDAFCLGCAYDSGYFSVREAVDIVVCNLGETSMHVASMLGRKFAMLHYDEAGVKKMAQLALRYGLAENLIPSHAFDMDTVHLQEAFEDPTVLLNPARQIAIDAARDGAGMLVSACGCINMILRTHGINEIGLVPVLEGNGVLIKMAEFMLDLKELGIKRSRVGFPQLTPSEIAELKLGFESTSLV